MIWQGGPVQRWRGVTGAPSGWGRCVVTIGVFDGVHRGHQQIIGRAVERARELGRVVDSVVVRGEPGPLIVRTALEGRYDAIFMSLRGEYRALDTMVLATNTRYVLQHAPCRVILGFAPKSIQPAAPPGMPQGAAV